MVRSVAFDQLVALQLQKINQKKQEHVGLLVSHRTSQKDIIVYLCQTPVKEDTKPSGKQQSKKPKNQKQDSLQIDDAWVCQYAKEVTRTLPGGFDVLGVYVASLNDDAKSSATNARQLLYAVSKTLQKDQEMAIFSDVSERILLHVSMTSSKFICQTYDVRNPHSVPNQVEWKQLPSPPKWCLLDSHVSVDLKFPVKYESRNTSIRKQIETGLYPFFERIRNSTALVDKVYRELEDSLIPAAGGKKSKSKFEQTSQNFTFDLLLPTDYCEESPPAETLSCSMMFTFKGVFECRAFVHNKATVLEAAKAIHQDMIRSIRARCEIHFEDLMVIDEEQQDPVVVFELPKRVYGPLGDSGLLVCDYQFHGDSAADSLTALKEILNLELTESDITCYESSPATSSLIFPEANEDRLSEFGDTTSSRRNMFIPAAGVAIAAVAAGISYMLWPNM